MHERSIPRHAPGPEASHRRAPILALTFLSLVAAACGAPDGTGTRVGPPLPPNLQAVDPDLARYVEAAVDAIHSGSNDPERWARLGNIYEANRLFELAVACYERSLELDPGQPKTWYRLGNMRFRSGDADGAIDALDRAGRLDPSYAPAYWQRGFRLLEAGHLDEAERAFRDATGIDPRDPAGWAGVARVALQRDDPAGATQVLERLILSHPRNPYLRHLLGVAYRELGRAEEAESELLLGRDSAPLWIDPWTQELLPHRVGFHAVLGEARRALDDGRVDIALPAFERLRDKRPLDPDVLAGLALANVQAGRLREGAQVLARLDEAHADDFRAQLAIATTVEAAGDLQRALKFVERSIALNPDQAAAHKRRGRILLRSERPLDGAEAFRRALELSPGDNVSLTYLGECLVAAKRWSEAEQALSRAARADRFNDRAWLLLGRAMLELGRREAARDALSRVVQLGGSSSVEARGLLEQMGTDS